MTTESADYCMLVIEWARSRSRVCLLRLEVDLGSVGVRAWTGMEIWCVKGMFRLKLVYNSVFKVLSQQNVNAFVSEQHQRTNSVLVGLLPVGVSTFDQSYLLVTRSTFSCDQQSVVAQPLIFVCVLSSFLFCTAGFQGEMECSKRHAYLTQFYRTVVDNLLPAKRRKGEEEGGEMVLVLDWQWETRRCYSYS